MHIPPQQFWCLHVIGSKDHIACHLTDGRPDPTRPLLFTDAVAAADFLHDMGPKGAHLQVKQCETNIQLDTPNVTPPHN